MEVHPGRAPEVLAFLKHVDDPLRTAVAIAKDAPDARSRLGILASAAAAFGNRVNARSLQALTREGRNLATTDVDGGVDRWLAIPTVSGQWVAAIMLEALGQHARAAEVLHSIKDVTWREERALRLQGLARNLLAAGRRDEAWSALRQAARAAETKQTLAGIGQLLNEAARTGQPPARAVRRVAVVGTGMLSFWPDVLKPALYGAGIWAEVFTGGFGQYQQDITDPDSALAKFRPDVVLIAVDYRALGLPPMSSDADAAVDAVLNQFGALWTVCHERFGAALVQFNFEIPDIDPFGRLSAAVAGGLSRVLQRVNLQLWDAAQRASVAVLDMNEAAAEYGKHRWNDSRMWIAAKQYPAAEALPSLARRIASVVRAVCGLTSKCLVLDLDGTLWGGVIGEDGLAGIRLGGEPEGEAYVSFQRYVQTLRRRGIPLAVCSKNNEADALSVFRDHPETVLREDDFAVFLANWDPKPDNLRRIATMLNIGIDSLVFLDDNPMERNFIRKELPEVEVPELPDDPALFTEVLHRTYLFESLTLSQEDQGRSDSYRENAQRSRLAAGRANVNDYLVELGMKLELRPFDELNLPRIVQLINKTNQFNLTTRRATAADAKQWLRNGNCYTQAMRLSDRFGDSGITGILVAFHEGDVVRIDNWLVSCRVLGRRVENAMLASLIDFAQGVGARAIAGEYLPTAKNEQVKDLYPRLGFVRVQDRGEGSAMYELSLDGSFRPVTTWFEVSDSTAHSRQDQTAAVSPSGETDDLDRRPRSSGLP
jgi:FkbH-like protein